MGSLRRLLAPRLTALERELEHANDRCTTLRRANATRREAIVNELRKLAATPGALAAAAFTGYALGGRRSGAASLRELNENLEQLHRRLDAGATGAPAAGMDFGALLATALRVLNLVSAIDSVRDAGAARAPDGADAAAAHAPVPAAEP